MTVQNVPGNFKVALTLTLQWHYPAGEIGWDFTALSGEVHTYIHTFALTLTLQWHYPAGEIAWNYTALSGEVLSLSPNLSLSLTHTHTTHKTQHTPSSGTTPPGRSRGTTRRSRVR